VSDANPGIGEKKHLHPAIMDHNGARDMPVHVTGSSSCSILQEQDDKEPDYPN